MQNISVKTSKTRGIYIARLVGRILVFCVLVYLYIFRKDAFDIVEGWRFFETLSPLHLLWILWMSDMILQLIPVKAHISIGSQKVFESFFRPIKEKVNYHNLKQYIKQTTHAAYRVMIVWLVVTGVVSVLYWNGIINQGAMILIAAFFYVCDLICVLVWCPFRLIMKNKCCTTCRIFNWDHFMMFFPIITVNSFYSWTLVLMSIFIWMVWEFCVFLYPERFWENSNMALQCSECSDKLCTQYCRKLRK